MSKFKFHPELAAKAFAEFDAEKIKHIDHALELANENEIDESEYEEMCKRENPELFENLDKFSSTELNMESIMFYIRVYTVLSGLKEVVC